MTAFEMWTLFYLTRGRKYLAGFYSVCYFVMNIFYYSTNFDTLGWKYASAIFLSFIIPFSIFFGSEEIYKMILAQDKKDEEKPIREELDTIKEDIADIRFKQNWDKTLEEPVVVNKKVKKIDNE